jgi:hypothetical protein
MLDRSADRAPCVDSLSNAYIGRAVHIPPNDRALANASPCVRGSRGPQRRVGSKFFGKSCQQR